MSVELVAEPDAEAMLVSYLAGHLEHPVSTQVPASRAGTFVRVVRTGGYTLNAGITSAQLTVESWGVSETAAVELALLVGAWVRAWPAYSNDVHRVECQGLGNSPDPESRSDRYVQTFHVYLRLVILP